MFTEKTQLLRLKNKIIKSKRKYDFKLEHLFHKYIFSSPKKEVRKQEAEYGVVSNKLSKGQYKIATFNNLHDYKTSDTLFILGTGSSINSISNSQWKLIREHDSIGLNLFLAHPFIPTFYHLEFTPLLLKYFEKWKSIKDFDFKKTSFINFSLHLDEGKNISDYVFSKHTYFSVPRRPYTHQNKKAFIKILNKYYAKNAYKENNVYLHHKGSLTVALSIGVLLGYKNIILHGVDLNNSNYFYEDQVKFPDIIGQDARDYLEIRKKVLIREGKWSDVHETNNKKITPISFTIPEFIQLYYENVLNELDVKLFIGNKSSALYPYLPYYNEF